MLQWIRKSLGCSKRPSGSSNQLSTAEVQAVKAAWERSKRRDVGQKILKALIIAKPQFMDYFGIKPEDNNMDKLFQCKAFQVQAHRIQNFLDTAVSTLGFCPMDAVYAMARRIGSIHFYRGVNFGADNWLVFKNVTVDQVNEFTRDINTGNVNAGADVKSWPRKEVVRSATQLLIIAHQKSFLELPLPPPGGICLSVVGWEKFMSAIVREMKKGFLDEACRNCNDDGDQV